LSVTGSLSCPTCGQPALRHSRPRSWFERLRRRITGRVPYRCRGCNWRGWRHESAPGGDGPREIHRALTESELEKLEPDSEGDRL
jgi:hypothetical protein